MPTRALAEAFAKPSEREGSCKAKAFARVLSEKAREWEDWLALAQWTLELTLLQSCVGGVEE